MDEERPRPTPEQQLAWQIARDVAKIRLGLWNTNCNPSLEAISEVWNMIFAERFTTVRVELHPDKSFGGRRVILDSGAILDFSRYPLPR